jgi:hypothetical protein
MKKQRPEFKAWCELLRHQIKANQCSILQLKTEINAINRLMKAQKTALTQQIEAEKKNATLEARQ